MAPIAAAVIPGVIGAIGSYKSAKDAKKAAAKGVNEQSTTTRTPYGPAASHIDTILEEAGKLYGQGSQGPMPYAWQDFLNNPTSPGAGANPTYGGKAAGSNLTWRGKDKAEVQAAKAARQQARTDARKTPAASPGAGGGESPTPGAPAAPAAPEAPGGFKAQSGPFGYSQGLRDYMMQQMQGPGVGGYQPAMQYIQGLLGGQGQNPLLSQAFQRASEYKNPYFQQFLPK